MSQANSVSKVGFNDYQSDLLTPAQKLAILAADPLTKGIVYIVVPLICIVFPLSLPFMLIIIAWTASKKPVMEFPGRMPAETMKPDKTDRKPGGKGFHCARGQVYLGRHRFTQRECWISWSDMMMHLYGLGATGSGKTQAIWAIYINFLCAGSGFSMGDGKGTLQFIREGQIAARRFGVENEYFVINYASESSGSSHYTHKILTHKTNPWSEGTAGQLKELLASVSLAGDAGQNQFFNDGAASIIERIFPALVELRNSGLQDLNMEVIGHAMSLSGMYSLASTDGVSSTNKSFLIDYLKDKGFDFAKHREGKPQNPEIIKQHGQFSSHFSKAVSSFSVQYRDMYMVDHGDVSMKDIIRNRRLLVFTLPSLEKSGSELKMLGKILISSQKNAVSIELGDELEGTRTETIDKLSSSHVVPYGLCYDEWAFYSIPDMAMLPAQIRGIKFSGGFFAQDYAGTTGAGDKDAEQIFANTRVKFFGAIEETGQTWEKFRTLIGEVRQAVNKNYKYLPGMFGGRSIIDRKNTEIIHREEVEISEVQDLVEGEFFMAMRGRLSPISFYYTGLTEIDEATDRPFKMNRFSRVYPPNEEELAEILKREQFLDILFSGNKLFTKKSSQITAVSDYLHTSGDTYAYSQQAHTFCFLSALEAFSSESEQSLNVSQVHVFPNRTVATSTAISQYDTQENSISTDIDPEPTVVDPIERIQSVESAENTPQDVAKMISGFSLPSSPSLSVDVASGHMGPVHGSIEENNVYDEYLDHRSEKEIAVTGKFSRLLSNRESTEIKAQTKSIMLLLGAKNDFAEESAKDTVNKINDLSFYIPPPKPHALPKEVISDLIRRADKLLED
jgi:hypothetical protein